MSAFSGGGGTRRGGRGRAIGGNDPAFFANERTIVKWVNATLKLSLGSLSEASNGAAFCQLCDMLYPKSIGADWKKVNWLATYEHDKLENYSILNRAFARANIKQNVPVNDLAKGKKVDLLKFWQWMMGFWSQHNGGAGDNYNVQERRAKCKNGTKFTSFPQGQVNQKLQGSPRRAGTKIKRHRPQTISLTADEASVPSALQSPHFRAPSPITTMRSSPQKGSWNDMQDESLHNMSQLPDSPLSKHMQMWEDKKKNLLHSVENSQFSPSFQRRKESAPPMPSVMTNAEFLKPWLESPQNCSQQPSTKIYSGQVSFSSEYEQRGGSYAQQYRDSHSQQPLSAGGYPSSGQHHTHGPSSAMSTGDSVPQEFNPMSTFEYVNKPLPQEAQLYEQNYGGIKGGYTPQQSKANTDEHPVEPNVVMAHRRNTPSYNSPYNININVDVPSYFPEDNVPKAVVALHPKPLPSVPNDSVVDVKVPYCASDQPATKAKVRQKPTPPRHVEPKRKNNSPRRKAKFTVDGKVVRKQGAPSFSKMQNDKPVPSYMRSTAATRLWKDSTAAEKKKPKNQRTEIY